MSEAVVGGVVGTGVGATDVTSACRRIRVAKSVQLDKEEVRENKKLD